jgi:hypothetical protein
MIPQLTLIKAGAGVLTKSADGTLDKAALVHLVSAIAQLLFPSTDRPLRAFSVLSERVNS